MVEQGKILINEKVGKDIWRMEIKAPWIAKKAAAGQFVNVKLNKSRCCGFYGERRYALGIVHRKIIGMIMNGVSCFNRFDYFHF